MHIQGTDVRVWRLATLSSRGEDENAICEAQIVHVAFYSPMTMLLV